MDSKKFNATYTVENMKRAYQYLQANKDVPFT